MKRFRLPVSTAASQMALLLMAACASAPGPAELDAQALAMLQSSFRDEGIASVRRLEQDEAQRACSSERAPSEETARRIEQSALASIRWPADGQYLGDWREGEKLAQSGRGGTWTDKSASSAANGASCYNCHQLSKEEISFGTIGPSLYHYGRLRGVSRIDDPAVAPIVQYTWGKLWNSRAYAACSAMPRFGHAGLLDETQLRHLMALLLDPQSPVNR